LEEGGFQQFIAPGRGKGAEHLQADQNRVTDAPGSGIEAGEGKFDGQSGAVCLEEMIDAAGVSREDAEVLWREGTGVIGGGMGHAEAAHFEIAFDGRRSENSSQLAGGLTPGKLHLKQAVLGVDKSLSEPSIVIGGGLDMGNAIGVAGNHGAGGHGCGHRAGGLGQNAKSEPPNDTGGRGQKQRDEIVDIFEETIEIHVRLTSLHTLRPWTFT
jgi:hypothetical protein